MGLLSALVGGCAPGEVTEFFRDETPHEAYERSLSEAGLLDNRIGVAWLDAAAAALTAPVQTTFPYEEEGVFRAAEPSALGYELILRQGQEVRFDLELLDEGEGQLFLEVFEAPEEAPLRTRPVIYSDSLVSSLRFEPPSGGRFLVRLQPELLVDARYRLTIRVDGALAFPVDGRGMSAILSFWGDPREGGRRSHHGVDIFAPRGTPVLAVSEGVVSRVEETNLGGLVVWVRDRRRNQSAYYAHLNEQLVRDGQRVQRGDTLGTVGNSGNARTTAPHLHFGIYRRGSGPINPLDHIRRLPQEPGPREADASVIGTWVLTRDEGVRLRRAPGLRTPVLAELEEGIPVQVLATAGSWYRVQQADGTQGFINHRVTLRMDDPIGTIEVAASEPLYRGPLGRETVDALPPNVSVPIRGEYGDFLYVESPSGSLGWMRNAGS